jgi:hypothetical protein
MEFQLSVPVIPSDVKIDFSDKLCFLGSCFSAEIGERSVSQGMHSISNPFGTIFHPIPLARLLNNSILGIQSSELLVHNKSVYDWDSAHVFFSSTKEAHQLKIKEYQNLIKEQLKGSSWLFITFGTANGYRLKSSNFIVSNCHKQNQSLFYKELISPDEMYDHWEGFLKNLYQFNPSINVVFTVSPVRHVKDGLIKNNQSKSRLFLLLDKLKENFPVAYFPAYEILIDALRDYRFYKKDLVHPNEQAIDFVWSHFIKTYYSDANTEFLKRITKLKAAESHEEINGDPIEVEKLKNWIKTEKNKLKKEIGDSINL